MKLARLAAQNGEIPVGAVVVYEGRAIGSAANEKEASRDPTAHAEILAIRRATAAIGSWRLSEATLYVTLEPCPMCAGALVQARLKRLVYGAADRKGGAVESVLNVLDPHLWNHRVDVVAGILEEECQAVLKNFFLNRRMT